MHVSSVPSVSLKYRIARCTGHSGAYVAENILVDNPSDETSRWSGSTPTENTRQWIVLELAELSLVRNITFGKFHKKHLCDMKEFKIYVGRTMDSLSLALHAYLLNDATPETFEFRRINRSGLLIPIRYLKIVPISAHSASFNTSIWHVALSGVNEPQIVKHAQEAYTQYTETQTLRHVLKFLRQQRHLAAYDALSHRADQPLEHPMITRVYDELMLGNWSTVESLVANVAAEGLFDQQIAQFHPKAIWRRLNGSAMNGERPSARGGHQMCIDIEAQTIYLFGGWNGHHDLDDLWCYSIDEQRWRLLTHHTAEDAGPSPRSCHKMVFDSETGYIYVLGRVADTDDLPSTDVPNSSQPSQTPLPAQSMEGSTSADNRKQFASDFYRYSTRGSTAGIWSLLSDDTATEDGPSLIYDHQVAIDSEKQTLYVSGGRIVDPGPMRFSGFYEYHIATGKWERIRNDIRCLRYGHSMVFDAVRRHLIFLAGKTGETFLTDMYIYDVDCRRFIDITNDFTAQGGPDPSFCQRAVIDQESGFLFTLPGFLKPKSQKNPNDGALQSAFWIYKPNSSTWIKVSGFRPSLSETDWQINDEAPEPPPRFAHEMVYDPVRNTIYVHGGNSGDQESQRLDDFWSMNLSHPTRDDFVRKATYIIRKQQFKELCEIQSPVQALTFLQQEVYSMVDHSSNEETESFRALHSHLFDKTPYMNRSNDGLEEGDASVHASDTEQCTEQSDDTPTSHKSISLDEDGYRGLDESHFRQRTEVFESFLGLINSNAKQPETDLMNIMEEMDML